MVEQLTLNQWVQGSSPWRCTTYSSIAQSVERMTVNHDVTGSSPVRGAIKKRHRNYAVFFLCFFVCIHLWVRTNSATSLTDHCSLRERTVKGLPCSCVMAIPQTSIQIKRYSHGLTPNTASGMHDVTGSSPVRRANLIKKKTILHAPLAQLVEQLTFNLVIGIISLLITLAVLLAHTISSPANIRFAYARVWVRAQFGEP